MAEFKVGSFTANTATGSQAVTGVSFQPKAILFFMSGSSAASGTWQSDVHQSIGFTSGAAESYSVSGASDDAVGTTNTGRRIAAKCITVIDVDGATVVGEADLTSFDSDGFTIDWTDAPAKAHNINFLAIGGSDVSAKAINWTTPTATGNKAVTGVGFTPDTVLHCTESVATSLPLSGPSMLFGFGAMDAAGNQWANSLYSSDGAAFGDAYRYQRTDKAIASITTTVREEAQFVSMDADGFTLNFTTVNANALQCISLCLSGLDAKVGNFAKTTGAAPASQAVTGVGFAPGMVLLSSFANVATTAVQSHAAWALGGGDGTNERTALQVDVDALATTDAESLWKNDKILALQDTVTGTVDAEADLTSLDADGYTLDWTTNDAVADEILYLALASINTAPNAPSGLSPDGVTIDKDATQRFSWSFSDPDSGDAQSAYDLRYRVVGTSTWTTVSGGATEYHDFAAGTFAAGDWEWEVRTTDNGGLVGPYSATATFTAATTPTAPSISDPISGGTVSSDPYTVQWTAPAQEAYQVRTVADDGGGSPDTGTVYQDTGTVESSSARSRSMPFPVNGRTEHVQVRVRVDGLWSAYASVSVNVSYTAPPTPAVVVLADDVNAAISLAISNPAPTGSEPTVTSNEVWVRVAAGGRPDIDRTVADDGIRIATGIANNGAYTDRAVASGVDYEYRVQAMGDNDVSSYSAWTG